MKPTKSNDPLALSKFEKIFYSISFSLIGVITLFYTVEFILRTQFGILILQ